MTNTWLNDSAPKQLFKDKDLQLLMFDKRMKFISPDGRNNDKITFSSSYYCWNFLPKADHNGGTTSDKEESVTSFIETSSYKTVIIEYIKRKHYATKTTSKRSTCEDETTAVKDK